MNVRTWFGQAATLFLGLIKNHPWVGGNKRTATALVDEFLFRNGVEVKASLIDLLELVVAVEAGRWEVDEIERWLRQHVAAFPVDTGTYSKPFLDAPHSSHCIIPQALKEI